MMSHERKRRWTFTEHETHVDIPAKSNTKASNSINYNDSANDSDSLNDSDSRGNPHDVSKSMKPLASVKKYIKTSACSGGEIITVELGDLVWGKITSHPWWPGLVISHIECCQKVPKEGHLWVFWLGHNTVSEVSLKNMIYFYDCDQSFFEKVPQKRRFFKEGLVAAIKLAAERTGENLDTTLTSQVLQYAFHKCQEDGHPKQISGSIPTFVRDVLSSIQMRNKEQQEEEDDSCSVTVYEDDEVLPQLEEITSVKDICLVCRKHDSTLKYRHPLYEGKVCCPCKERIKMKIFATDNNNKFYCSVCTRKGMLDCMSCPRTFCEACKITFLNKCDNFNQWKCLLCEPATNYKNLLEVRHNFIQEVTNLFTEDSSGLDPDELQKIRRPIVVLSLFDGISTGLVVLQKLGVCVKAYYACEVDENATTVSKARFGSQVTHLGDVKNLNTLSLKKLGAIDMLIGGSPCNDLSLVNPARRGFDDIESSALLFYEYYRILQQVVKSENFFWLYENTANMPAMFEETINRFLQSKPKKIDARFFSAHNRARFFWGNIPAMGETKVPASSPNLDEVVNKTFGRKAQVRKMRTITTNANTLLGQGPANVLPVIVDGKEDTLWITEVEEVFGFPRHFTDVGTLSRKQRLDLLGRAWSVQVVEYILRPLTLFFATSNNNKEDCDTLKLA
ncbi:DNA (cytosine-5)-methyltransferase 3A-like isoform X3 [Bacillus rossius redtenbacheri]